MSNGKAIEKLKRRRLEEEEDEEILSGSDISQESEYSSEDESFSEDDGAIGRGQIEKEQILAEKRLKTAKEYLANLGHDVSKKDLAGLEDGSDDSEEDIDAEDVDRELIASRLRQDALQAKGKHFERIADEILKEPTSWTAKSFRAHNQTPTCIAMTRDASVAFSASKGGDIIKWNLDSGKRIHTFSPPPRKQKKGSKTKGHTNQILCIAVSFDGKYVATGGLDKTIQIWDGHKNIHLGTFTQHRDAVTGLVFQFGTYQLYSCSADRTIKIWACDQLAYIDTLFGHQDAIPAIHCLAQERCITVGSRDRTTRLWKIPEESQLIFRASEETGGSLETLKMFDEEHFVTGSDEGALSVWSLGKKKPFKSLLNVHADSEGIIKNPIISMASCPFTDMLATGSENGKVELWKVEEDFKSLTSMGSVEIPGFVNGLCLSEDGRTLLAVAGRDHRLGRWRVNNNVQNRLFIVRF